MPNLKKLILVGGGGHCKSCIDVIEQEGQYEITGILDKEELIGQKVLGYEIIGSDDNMEKYAREGYTFLITVGQIKSSSLREELFVKLQTFNAEIATIISPRAYVSKHTDIGKGTIIMHDVLVNVNTSIGENCIINSKALIEHDATIEDFSHISTSAVINGGVVVKRGSFFGSNAVSKEYVETSINDFIKAGTIFKGNL
ncbi:MAG: 4-amino-6-deoxy-N-Acetyl-D-hexosaminyl-(Lipid carrier) acetyltrasferase [uncultured Sulfurovum sp.]|uniref:4-amino-6-deoxy-N-Acetyl-D-hexosaminyl-(Lipid carrier) acetyltrasferase n=1 Tax=uncultured Sulfurovum sp. TaxID=269237 RepID=A0A6S6UFI5_9BACT|nr:MAG: 4-amino-6-deoxy-N-Acetyl-D-hexosaminyl-(Lipid carrier) acetyltrasferase [uncultured Sulfurovum sp.]